MKSFIEFITEYSSKENKYGKKVPHQGPYPHTDPSGKKGQSPAHTTFWLSRRNPDPDTQPELVDFGAAPFAHGFANAKADAAKIRWRVTAGKRAGHLSKET
jgi:hypothetical protein